MERARPWSSLANQPSPQMVSSEFSEGPYFQGIIYINIYCEILYRQTLEGMHLYTKSYP